MSEKVIVRQNSKFETEFFASDPESGKQHHVDHVNDLTPYGMLLASLGTCTTVLLHTYAKNHGIKLDEAEITLRYERVFRDDCRNCEEILVI